MSNLFGGGKSPAVNYATEPLKEEAKKAKSSRSALLATMGGIEGEELSGEQVKKRETLLGN